jgi:hypothetical protein
MRQYQKEVLGKSNKLTKAELREVNQEFSRLEAAHIINGLNFSRVQIDELLRAREAGDIIEFETLGPYLADYVSFDGAMSDNNLLTEDRIGLQLAKELHDIFPNGRLVALCDEYNATSAHSNLLKTASDYSESHFSQAQRERFRKSLVALFKSRDVLDDEAIEGKDYLLLNESAKVADAPILVERLENKGYIQRNGDEIIFCNTQAENPLHQSFTLRTKQGRWLCEALDAASFIRPRNLSIVHIVVLPSYMRPQQDRVWEILRVLNIFPSRYHNVFYDPDGNISEMAKTLQTVFAEPQDLFS